MAHIGSSESSSTDGIAAKRHSVTWRCRRRTTLPADQQESGKLPVG